MKALLLATTLAAASQPARAQAVPVVTLEGGAASELRVRVAWSDGWRDAEGSERGSRDGAWLFSKWRLPDGAWLHLPLDGVDGDADEVAAAVAPDGVGALVERRGAGRGDVRWALRLRLREPLPTAAQVRVFALRMVRVAEGAFDLGGGAGDTPGRFHAGDDAGRPFRVGAQTPDLARRAGALWADDARWPLPGGALGLSLWDGGRTPLDPAFPTGFRAFWIMRSEPTQGEYAAFLDTLTARQAQRRFADAAERKAVGAPRDDDFRFTLQRGADGRFDSRRPELSMNWLSWEDGIAFAAWAGLRPMTELEYEKAARGPLPAVPREYAWGGTRIVAIRGFEGDGEAEALPADANASWSPSRADRPLLGPYRAGQFDARPPSRALRGESFWGVSDLSGNLVEMAVSAGPAAGRGFRGEHGRGRLDDAGAAADVPSWPRIPPGAAGGFGAHGFGYRGGDFYNPELDLRVSARNVAAFGGSRRLFGLGFRAVRTAEDAP